MKTGEKHILRHVVTHEDTAEVLGSGGLPVYSTPSMICLMEKTSYELAAMNGDKTVGTKVNISHLRACKVGTEVTSTAEIIEIDGRRLTFRVSVSDAQGLLGEGTHERFIIDPDRFLSKIK